jgi:hypothetical protein
MLASGDCPASAFLPGMAPTTLYKSPTAISAITDDGTDILFAAAGLDGDNVYELTGGSAPHSLASNVGDVDLLALSISSNEQLLFYAAKVGSAWQVDAITGGGSDPYQTGLTAAPTALATNSSGPYVASGGEVMDPFNMLVVQGSDPILGMTVDEEFAYWSTAGEIHRTDLMAFTSTVVATGLGTPRSLAVDNMNVYWIDTQEGRIQATAKDGSASVATIASGAVGATQLVLDGASLYWASPQGVFAAPFCVCGPVTRLSSDPASFLTFDANRVLWVDTCSSSSAIVSAPKP